ncbi:hypothetical protein SAMN05443572_1021016 [Myxococcus fulvus]|uniref:Lipoprotein n=2 Tax=Myxococcus fulvus TaxID=33 RepID=A0ABY1C4K7_MYXFU|nr:hypothetical protein SAMN05443572_1021016 [Myxococcus fulvus]
MAMRLSMGGLLVVMAGTLGLGCGVGPEADAESPAQTEQALVACEPGFSPQFTLWYCEPGCNWTVNVAYLVCRRDVPPHDTYEAGEVARSCGACF